MKEHPNHYGSPEKDILFSRSVKAGKRIYYIDVKQNSHNEMYLSLTESKKIVTGDAEMPQFNYEKHKIFVYPEDFEKFSTGIADAMKYIFEQQGHIEQRPEVDRNEIKLDDIEF